MPTNKPKNMNLSISVNSLRGKIFSMFKRFPLSVLYASALSITLIVFVLIHDYHGVIIYYLSAGYLMSTMLHLWGEEVKTKGRVVTITIVANIALLVDAVVLWFRYEDFSLDVYMAHTAVIVAFMLGISFLSFFKAGTDIKSWNFVRTLIFWVCIAFIIGSVMAAGISGLVFGFGSLFGVDINNKVFSIIGIISCQLLPQLLILATIPSNEKKHNEAIYVSQFLMSIIRFLFIPLILCYMLVLYTYLAKVIFLWQLPNGEITWLVSTMMLGIIFIIFLLYPALQNGAKGLEKLFVKWAPLLSLPLLVLMSIGIFRRLSDYGITTNRLYVLTINIWFYVVAIGLYFNNTNRIHWISLSFGAILLMTSAQPFNYYYISVSSSKCFIEKIMNKYPPKSLPMSNYEYASWIEGLPHETALVINNRLDYLNDIEKRYVDKWINGYPEFTIIDRILNGKKEKDDDHSFPNAIADTFACYDSKTSVIDIPNGFKHFIDIHSDITKRKAQCVKDNVFIMPVIDSSQKSAEYHFKIDIDDLKHWKSDCDLKIYIADCDSVAFSPTYVNILQYHRDINIECSGYLFFNK